MISNRLRWQNYVQCGLHRYHHFIGNFLLRLRTLIVYEFELLAPKGQLVPQSQLRQGRNSSNLKDYFLQFKNLLMNDFWLKILSKEGAKNVTSPGTVTSLQTWQICRQKHQLTSRYFPPTMNSDLDAEGALAMITENVEAELKPIKFETWLSKSLRTSLATYCNNVIDSKRRRKGKII